MSPKICRSRRRVQFGRQAGFTLLESIMVLGLLGLVSAGLLSMYPQIYKTQNAGRDEHVGHELQRACAERVLAVRRNQGYSAVSTTACAGVASVAGLAPALALAVAGAASSPCAGSRCTATITVTRAGTAVLLPAITLELSVY